MVQWYRAINAACNLTEIDKMIELYKILKYQYQTSTKQQDMPSA